MAADFGLASLTTALPQVLQAVELGSLVILVFFYGGLVVSSFRSPFRGLARYALVIGFGILALMGGTVLHAATGPGILQALSLPPFLESIFGSFIFGFLAAAILAVSLWLLTLRLPAHDRIAILERDVARMRMLLEHHRLLKPIDLAHARAIAERAVPLPAVRVERAEDQYLVVLENAGTRRFVRLDALSGDVLTIDRFASRVANFISHPPHALGIAVLLVFVLLTASLFRGFPSATDAFADDLLPDVFNAVPGCPSLAAVLTGPAIADAGYDLTKLPEWTNAADRDAIAGGSGGTVVLLRSAMHDGEQVGIGLVQLPSEETTVCVAAAGTFCGCTGSPAPS